MCLWANHHIRFVFSVVYRFCLYTCTNCYWWPTHFCSWAAMCTESIMRRRASEICLALTVCCSNLVFTADCEMHSYTQRTCQLHTTQVNAYVATKSSWNHLVKSGLLSGIFAILQKKEKIFLFPFFYCRIAKMPDVSLARSCSYSSACLS